MVVEVGRIGVYLHFMLNDRRGFSRPFIFPRTLPMSKTFRILFAEVPILGGVLLAAGAFALGWVLRYQVIEPVEIGIACEEAANPAWWCGGRTALIVAMRWIFGYYLVLALAALAWMSPGRRWRSGFSLAALGLSGLGLVLYNAGPSVLACVATVLGLIRLEKQPAGEAPSLEDSVG